MMTMTKTKILFLSVTVLSVTLAARQAPEPVDAAMNAKIRDEGLNRSQVGVVFNEFVDVIGPRLTASPAHKRAADFARDTMAKWGLTNSHLESWQWEGRGWEMQKLTIEMIEPRYMPLIGYPEAWTPSTPGELVVSAVWTAGKSPEELAQMPIAGNAVLGSPIVTAFIDKDRESPILNPNARIGAPPSPRQGGAGGRQGAGGAGAPGAANPAGAAGVGAAATGAAAGGAGAGGAAAAGQPARAGGAGGRGGTPNAPGSCGAGRGANPALAKAAVVIKPSLGMHGTVFVQAGNCDNPGNTQPAVVIAGDDYNIIARLLEHNVPVKLRVNVQTKFVDADKKSYNVIAEIPGTDPMLKDQVVMLGGHLDSWHTGTGATDNADGAASVMEALRILKAVGAQPKRTIRVGIWSGEEEGLFGSKAYVRDHLEGDAHKAERDNFDVYFNTDPGRGPIYGWYLEENEAARPIFDAWLAPFKDLGAVKNVTPKVGNTDHLSYIAVGLPGFNPVQDYTDYDTRLHHTNADTAEMVKLDDLKQNAIIMASFAYHAAMRPAMIPSPVRK
jgi:hypothetical protein